MYKRRITVFFLVLIILFSFVLPVCAREASSTLQFGTFWDAQALYCAETADRLGIFGFLPEIASQLSSDDVCVNSDDHLHHGEILGSVGIVSSGEAAGYIKLLCSCKYCGRDFYSYKSSTEVSASYDEYVEEKLPTSVKIIDSEGGLIWKPTVYDMRVRLDGFAASMYKDPSTLLGITALNHLISVGRPQNFATPVVGDNPCEFAVALSVPAENAASAGIYPLCSIAPVSGVYSLLDPYTYDFKVFLKGTSDIYSFKASYPFSGGFFTSGDVIFFDSSYRSMTVYSDVIGVVGSCHLPSYKITPLIPLDTGVGGSFGPDTRPGSVSGDFGYVGEDGEVSKVGDTYFFDESTTTYHNPVTGDTSNVTEWNYDYSDRSYNVVTDSGNTITITYGDENVTVSERTVNDNGDTVTNNYTYYYITNNASPSPVVPHTHSYSDAVTQAPTCIMPGVKTFTCSCGDSYTQNIPATGHSWSVRETVLTQYDDTGNLLQQGYTIFKCTVCGEENKSETSSVPPGGGDSGSGVGTGSGSGGLFSGIFSIIWDFFSFCWGFFNDFVAGGIRSFLDGLLHTTGTFLSFLNPFNWFS